MVYPGDRITGKIWDVPDTVCHGCSQLWEQECRAFSFPHSQAEREWRIKDGPKPILNCVKPKPKLPLDGLFSLRKLF